MRIQIVVGYIDSGTGGVILQMLLGGIAGLGVLIKMRWQSIRTRFRRGTDS
jgi:hypothetical protein